jgi:hypothetical protein
MPKSDTMQKLFWSIYDDLSYLDKLKAMEKMLRGLRLEEESAAIDTEAHEAK